MTAGSIAYRIRGGGGADEHRVLVLTLVDPAADDAIYAVHGVSGLRRYRLVRLLREADEQGERLGYDDLRSLLLTSRATLKRDISELETEGHLLPLRGRRRHRGGAGRAEARRGAAQESLAGGGAEK